MIDSLAAYQSTEEDRIDVMITLYAEIARTYVGVRIYQAAGSGQG